jgi:superoxide reductase
MAKRNEVYKCREGGMLVEVLMDGDGELQCHGQAMKGLVENTVDAAKEKHVPVIEKVDGGFKVKVGDVAHPMEAEHWIVFIEVMADGKVYRQYLNPGDPPEATFPIDAAQVTAREFCNLHGLWKA